MLMLLALLIGFFLDLSLRTRQMFFLSRSITGTERITFFKIAISRFGGMANGVVATASHQADDAVFLFLPSWWRIISQKKPKEN